MVRFTYPITQQIITLFTSPAQPRPVHCSQGQIHVAHRLVSVKVKDNSCPSSILAFVMHAVPFWGWATFASHKLKCTWVSECLQISSDTIAKAWFLSKGHVFQIHILTSAFTQNIPNLFNRSRVSGSQTHSGELPWTIPLPQMEGPSCPLTAFSP